MRKTNIRVDNVFIIEDNGKHYLSGIDQVDEWSDLQDNKLKKKGEDITKKLSSFLDKYDISSNVNFIDFEGFQKKGGFDSGDDDDLDDGGS